MCVYGAFGPAQVAHRIINTTLHLEGFKNYRLGLNNFNNTCIILRIRIVPCRQQISFIYSVH